MTKKLIFGIFAHPDDEAFGPSGYLYRQAQTNVDVHLVMVTDGAAGHNESYDDLAAVRHAEWLESGRRIGVKSNLALGYADGSLCNNLYHEISDKIIVHIKSILKSYAGKVSVEFVTFESRGITGHIDHIAVSYITTYIYEVLKKQKPKNISFERILYFCLSDKLQPHESTDWLYAPAGLPQAEFGYIHDFIDIADTKLHIMRAHESQKKDLEEVILASHNTETEGFCTKECFVVKN